MLVIYTRKLFFFMTKITAMDAQQELKEGVLSYGEQIGTIHSLLL